MKRILLVEDNKLDRRIISELLSKNFSGHIAIDEASDGESAIKFLSQRLYDLVITDLIMPNIEGLQLIRYINNKLPNSNILAISGSRPFYLYLAKKLGIHGVFTKPLDTSKFLKTTGNLLNIASTSHYNM